jgi:hypothetical protein
MMTREELIDKIADLFIQGSESDGTWDACAITGEVMGLLTREGSDRLAECGNCSTWYPIHLYDNCPYWGNHLCEGCSEPNDSCSCEDCPDCGCYVDDCECPRCQSCGEKRGVCTCTEEEAVFK